MKLFGCPVGTSHQAIYLDNFLCTEPRNDPNLVSLTIMWSGWSSSQRKESSDFKSQERHASAGFPPLHILTMHASPAWCNYICPSRDNCRDNSCCYARGFVVPIHECVTLSNACPALTNPYWFTEKWISLGTHTWHHGGITSMYEIFNLAQKLMEILLSLQTNQMYTMSGDLKKFKSWHCQTKLLWLREVSLADDWSLLDLASSRHYVECLYYNVQFTRLWHFISGTAAEDSSISVKCGVKLEIGQKAVLPNSKISLISVNLKSLNKIHPNSLLCISLCHSNGWIRDYVEQEGQLWLQ